MAAIPQNCTRKIILNTLLRVYQIYAKYVHIVNENKGQYSEGCLDAGQNLKVIDFDGLFGKATSCEVQSLQFSQNVECNVGKNALPLLCKPSQQEELSRHARLAQ